MRRLIDANALLESKWWDSIKDDFDKARAKIIVQSCPTIDAVEVVHGRWIRYEHGSGIYCSHCRHKRRYKDEHDNYCPNCGAVMDGGNADV